MPTIVFANPKGGSGKTTSSLILASELASRGIDTGIVDADPLKWLTGWASIVAIPYITIYSDVSEANIVELIDQASLSHKIVIVDNEGTASQLGSYAIGMADLVILPLQGSSMDARGASAITANIRSQERILRRSVQSRILFTKTNGAIKTRSQRSIEEQLDKANIKTFKTEIVNRAAYRDIFDYGGLLQNLDPKAVSNIEKAVENAGLFADEVILTLKAIASEGEGGI